MHTSTTRRNFVRVGGLTAFGLGLGGFFQLQAAAAMRRQAKAKSCILVWLDGGPSHLESFDPKPDAPEEVRGPLESIATNVAGVRLGECMTRTAGIMDKLAIIRSMTSPLGEHNFGTHYLMTGYKPSPALEYPSYGATLAQIQQASGILPPHIAVPTFARNHSGNGYLPAATAPFSIGGNPEREGFKVRDFDLYQGLDVTRLDRRRDLVGSLNAFNAVRQGSTESSDPNLERAYNLISGEAARLAFDLSKESPADRNRYGIRGGNGIGQSCLLARRLVERGVPFVTVNSTGWDTHRNILQLKERYPGDGGAHLPAMDKAVAALITDLEERGLLNETLVIVMGEFGRTPKINSAGGRDHWPNVFSVAMAGAGISGGQIIGSSDQLGELPKDQPVTPGNLAATVYTLFGIAPETELKTRDGRPVRVAPDGAKVLEELMG